jgi:hypothetical protein
MNCCLSDLVALRHCVVNSGQSVARDRAINITSRNDDQDLRRNEGCHPLQACNPHLTHLLTATSLAGVHRGACRFSERQAAGVEDLGRADLAAGVGCRAGDDMILYKSTIAVPATTVRICVRLL